LDQQIIYHVAAILLDFHPSNAKLPNDCYETKKIIKDLGLSYEKIHACSKDCILYWKENANLETCPNYGVSRWENNESKDQKSTNASPRKEKESCYDPMVVPLKAKIEMTFYVS